MLPLKQLFNSLGQTQNGSFISLNGYASSTSGEVANYVLNAKCNYSKLQKADLKKLKKLTTADLVVIATNYNLDVKTCSEALTEMINSLEKNINGEKSNQSIGQIDAYEHIGNGVKLHLEKMELHLTGLVVSKNVILAGEYKTVNSRPKTIAKNKIEKYARLQCAKYRQFKISNIDNLKVNGNIIEL